MITSLLGSIWEHQPYKKGGAEMYDSALILLKNGIETACIVMAISLGLGILTIFLGVLSGLAKKNYIRLGCAIVTIICFFVFLAAFIRFLDLNHQKADIREKIANTEAQQKESEALKESLKRQEEEEKKAEEEREAARPIAERLGEKLNEIRTLRKDIDQKKTQVVDLRVHFVNTLDLLKADINTIKETEGIKTYSQAMRNQRIKNNLSLMQSKMAYKERIQEIEDGLTAAHYDLLYIEEKTVDDLKMSTVLGKEDMDKIIKQIERVIIRYEPETKKLVINEADMKLKSTQSIWDSIASESKPTTIPPGKSN